MKLFQLETSIHFCILDSSEAKKKQETVIKLCNLLKQPTSILLHRRLIFTLTETFSLYTTFSIYSLCSMVVKLTYEQVIGET